VTLNRKTFLLIQRPQPFRLPILGWQEPLVYLSKLILMKWSRYGTELQKFSWVNASTRLLSIYGH